MASLKGHCEVVVRLIAARATVDAADKVVPLAQLPPTPVSSLVSSPGLGGQARAGTSPDEPARGMLGHGRVRKGAGLVAQQWATEVDNTRCESNSEQRT